MITAHYDDKYVNEAVELEVDKFISKPFDNSQILDSISELTVKPT